MLTPNYDIITNEELLATPALQQLLAVVSPRFITYIVFNGEEKKVALLKQYQLDFFPDKTIEENLKDILETDSNLKKTYQKSFIIYDFPSAALIPEELFNTSLNKPATELLYGDVEKGLLLSEKVVSCNMYNVYRIPREIHTLLQHQFGSGKYWHLHSLLLENKRIELKFPYQLEVALKDDFIAVGLWKHDALQLIQQYPVETLEDMIYYLQLIVQQFSLHPGEIALTWCGTNKFVEDVTTNLQKYFSNVEQLPLTEGWSLGNAFDKIPVHYYTNYLNLVACV